MKRAFSLVELMIVVAILGILAAIVVPTFQGHILQTKESAAKDNLRILRNAIEVYAAKHNDVPPGYRNDDLSRRVSPMVFNNQMIVSGDYLSKMPVNPFSKLDEIKLYNGDDDFPTSPYTVETFGWLYKPATREIRLNWPGTDSTGVAYFDY